MLKTALITAALLVGGSAFAQTPPAPPAPPGPAAPPAPGAVPPPPPPGEAPAAAPMLPAPLACTFTHAFRCEADKSCDKVESLGAVKLPAVFLVDFGRRLIAGAAPDGLPHLSAIETVAGTAGGLTLQGVDGAIGWTMQMEHPGEKVSLTSVSHQATLSSFGTCKPVP